MRRKKVWFVTGASNRLRFSVTQKPTLLEGGFFIKTLLADGYGLQQLQEVLRYSQ
jgi:hypothetical protein